MKSQAWLVVIGGGMVGVSALCHRIECARCAAAEPTKPTISLQMET